jgi:preprotein translocase subunit YajC
MKQKNVFDFYYYPGFGVVVVFCVTFVRIKQQQQQQQKTKEFAGYLFN